MQGSEDAIAALIERERAQIAGVRDDLYATARATEEYLRPDSSSLRSNGMERDQVSDMMAASEARTDTKLATAMGEIREEFAKLNGRFDTVNARLDAIPGRWELLIFFFGTAVTIIGVLIAVLAYGGDRYNAGASTAEIAKAAAREVVAEQARRPASQPPAAR
jgi:hypothetical protein